VTLYVTLGSVIEDLSWFARYRLGSGGHGIGGIVDQ
jgi:hypothetical protein